MVFSASVCLGILHTGLKGLSKLDALSKSASRRWGEEYLLRRCVFREAARKNIQTAHLVLAKEFPHHRPRLEEEWKNLSDDLDRLYPEDIYSPKFDEEPCCSPEKSYCFSLFLESHSGQETPWPNFVPRLEIQTKKADI